jgi:exonuclease SbcC
MLPVKLTIQGVNSYQKLQTIEFGNLVSAKTFGIFGSVGSGKSTIPEAISFALYGKMERLNKSDSLSYNLMNLKSNTLLIDFEFEAEKNERYRFIVKGKRNSKNFDDVSLEKMRYKWSGETWIPDETLDAEKIIGLNYDNFKRTIIIPQNKFMEFIHLGDADRTKMLKEIFNLEKYDLLGKVKLLENQTELEISNLNGKLEGLKEIDQLSIEERKKELDLNLNLKNRIETQFIRLNNEFTILAETKILFENLIKTQEKYNSLHGNKTDIDTLEKELNSYKTCYFNFKSQLENKYKINDKINLSNKELIDLRVKHQKSDELIKTLKTDIGHQKQDYEKIDIFKTQNEELGKFILINKIDSSITETGSLLNTININIEKTIKQIDEIEKEILGHRNIIDLEEKNLKDISILSDIKEWFLRSDNIKQIISELEKNRKSKEEILQVHHHQKSSETQADELKELKIDQNQEIILIINFLESKVDFFAETLKKLTAEKEQLLVKLKIKEISDELTEGKPCPVCGSLSHPDPLKSHDLDSDINQILTRIQKGDELIKKINIRISNLKNINSNIQNEMKNIDDISRTIREKQGELSDHQKKFIWQDYSSENKNEVIGEIENTNKKITEIKNIRSKLENLLKSKDEKLKEKESVQKNQFALKNEIQSKTSQKETLLGQIKILDHQIYKKHNVNDLESEQIKMHRLISEISERFAQTESRLKAEEISLTEISTKINEIERISNQLSEEYKLLDITIMENLQKYGFKSETEVNSVLKKNLDISKTENQISEFKVNYEIVKSQKEEMEKLTRGKTFSQTIYDEKQREIENRKHEIEILQHKIGGLQSVINDWTEKLVQKNNFLKELNKEELRLEDLKTMRSLFTGNGFVNYISTMRLHELVNYANLRFNKLTKNRLSLILNPNNTFSILDYLNDGKKRNIKTLSGGQQFQVSLSLALALAGVVQKQNRTSQNFFFLDEGFGTQDEDSLNLVFDSITSLRKENRIVGLISHVAELKEGINAYLEIVNDEKSGSIINKSWEN